MSTFSFNPLKCEAHLNNN